MFDRDNLEILVQCSPVIRRKRYFAYDFVGVTSGLGGRVYVHENYVDYCFNGGDNDPTARRAIAFASAVHGQWKRVEKPGGDFKAHRVRVHLSPFPFPVGDNGE